MKVNNLYAKPILKAVFYIMLLLGIVNVGILLTQIQPFSDLIHISIAVSLFIFAGLIMSKNIFIKYNSEDAVLEIERAGLFSSRNTIHSSQLGFVKAKIQDFSVEKTWYGGAFTLVYSTSKGKPYSKRFPIFFGSTETMVKMNEDLKMITNKMATNERVDVAVESSKVLKNSPAFS
ncbi:hypothetical protein KFE94_04050 [bacterium SCSIO 12643]|nr:hypothetical protein KFE94_04050 [bacterium SCSIO 12643]